MKIDSRYIDHLVYCVPDLDEAMLQFKDNYGITPIYGGKHMNKGTHNAIVNLGNACYLEILAIDPENDAAICDRWMGIDQIVKPQITRWAIKSDNIPKDFKSIMKLNPALCKQDIGKRVTAEGKELKWEMSLPLSSPKVELIPFLIDWSKSDHHPTENLEQSCELLQIEMSHPDPNALNGCFEEMGFHLTIEKLEEVAIKASFQSKQGQFSI